MTEGLDARAKAVFEEAIDRTPEDRRAFLEGACAADPTLRARVDKLLAGAEQDDPFLSNPVITTITEPPSKFPIEQSGTRIGPYRLVQLLGEAGS